MDNPAVLLTRAHANVANVGAYAQQSVNFLSGRLRLESGLALRRISLPGERRDQRNANRYDELLGDKRRRPIPTKGRRRLLHIRSHAADFLSQLWTRHKQPGRARGCSAARRRPKIATTDFYQASAAFNRQRFSVSGDWFLIDHSNEQVYIPDDGTVRVSGAEPLYRLRSEDSPRKITRYLVFNSGVTQVTQAFFRGTSPRVYVDSSPRTVADARLTFSGFRGFYGTLAYRHTGNYRLDGEDATIRASGFDVLDLSISQRIDPGLTSISQSTT